MASTSKLIVLLGLVIMSPVVSLAWQENGVVICDDPNLQANPVIASDDSYGAIITWVDHRAGNYDIYAQRIDSSGTRQWVSGSDSNGVIVCNAAGYQHECRILADGSGGAIIIWQDKKVSPNDWDIYAQKLNSSGERQWTPENGILVWDGWIEINHEIVSDGAGGAIITCRDDSPYKIYAQKIISSGTLPWGLGAKIVSDASAFAKNPKVTADGAGGAIVVWWDERQVPPDTSFGIYAQKIDSDGNRQWGASDLCVCDVVNDQQDSRIVADGSGGAIITWDDDIYGNGSYYKTYAQRVNSSGSLQWGINGVCICDEISVYPEIVADGLGGAIIVWQDYRSGGNLDIYAQRVNSSGISQWTANGVCICNATGNQTNHKVITDGLGGAIITWDDQRDGRHDIYAQRVDDDGNIHPNWTQNGVLICDTTNAGFTGIHPQIATDGSNGVITTWQDGRNPDNNGDIYAQRVTADGAGIIESSFTAAPHKISFRLSPNPFKNSAVLYVNLPKSGLITIQLFDVLGRRRYSREIEYTPENNAYDLKEIITGEIPNGIYYLQIKTNGGIKAMEKLVKIE